MNATILYRAIVGEKLIDMNFYGHIVNELLDVRLSTNELLDVRLPTKALIHYHLTS